ncbi:MAG: hypothetical protein JWP81_3070 [Ferruginibacter sp.]|nr:hypothetical protein [Ferruginibacter sp.]
MKTLRISLAIITCCTLLAGAVNKDRPTSNHIGHFNSNAITATSNGQVNSDHTAFNLVYEKDLPMFFVPYYFR